MKGKEDRWEGREGRRRDRRKETSKQELYTQDKISFTQEREFKTFSDKQNSKSLSPANSNINKRKKFFRPKR